MYKTTQCVTFDAQCSIVSKITLRDVPLIQFTVNRYYMILKDFHPSILFDIQGILFQFAPFDKMFQEHNSGLCTWLSGSIDSFPEMI